MIAVTIHSNFTYLEPSNVNHHPFLDFVERVLQEVKDSSYSHKNVIEDEVWNFNCYGFISYLLKRYSLEAFEPIYQFMNGNDFSIPRSIDDIPCPFNYAAYFLSLNYTADSIWKPVEEIIDVQAGDFLAYIPPGYIPQMIETMPTRRTGQHIMIIKQVVKIEKDKIELVVIDCTREPHNSADTRVKGGIGCAPLTIHIEFSHTWIQWDKSFAMMKKELFIGRIKAF